MIIRLKTRSIQLTDEEAREMYIKLTPTYCTSSAPIIMYDRQGYPVYDLPKVAYCGENKRKCIFCGNTLIHPVKTPWGPICDLCGEIE